MTVTVVAFAATATFVLFFLRRRAKQRPEETLRADHETAINDVAESIDISDREARCSEAGLPFEAEAESATGVDVEPRTEQAPALEVVGAKGEELGLEFRRAAITADHPITANAADRYEPAPLDNLDGIISTALPQTLIEDAESPTGIPAPIDSDDGSFPTAPTQDNNNMGTGTSGSKQDGQAATLLLNDEIPLTDASGEPLQPQGRAEGGDSERTRKAPLRYRPPVQRPPQSGNTRPANQGVGRAGAADVGLEMRVRLKFDRFDFCEVTLLPERTAELDTEVEVKSGGLSLHLVSQEDWFQDLRLENIGEYLRDGLELKGVLADKRRVRWRLSGRDIYVLASHPWASYFVSTTRLALGRSHVVLCILDQLQQVEAILSEAGCQGYARLGESHGVPSGWLVLRGVSPTKPIPLDSGVDLFYALKPAPELEIEFEGGVCLRNSVWLAGYPPQIKLLGDLNSTVKVLIDGKVAERTADGSLVVEGSDLAGPHSVYCEGLSHSRSYSIEEPPDSWEAWPAYHFGHADICGPLVQLTPEAKSRRAFSVPMSNPLLLGAVPGQVFYCSSRRVVHWKGFVPFDVVWALPAQPLRCSKKTSVILQFSDAAVLSAKTSTSAGLAWSTAVLDASRKGLRVESGFPNSGMRWRDYKKVARRIRRGTR